MSRFCCFSMTNPNPTDASQSECRYYLEQIFNHLFEDQNGRLWCAVHAPKDVILGAGLPELPDQTGVFANVLNLSRDHDTGVIDLRKTYWRYPIVIEDWRQFVGMNPLRKLDFSGATFSQDVNLNGSVLAAQVNFDSATFEKTSTFVDAAMSISCKGAKFFEVHSTSNSVHPINYSSAIFECGVHLSAGGNPARAQFDEARIAGQSTFTLSPYGQDSLSFIKASVNGSLRIEKPPNSDGKVVLDSVDISDTLCVTGRYASLMISKLRCKELDFRNISATEFSAREILCREQAFFSGGINRSADFSGSRFEGDAIFSEMSFEADALFAGVAFKKSANFRNTIFSGDVDFSRATFSGDSTLETNRSDKHEKSTKSFKRLNLDRTYFKGIARFTNREFSGSLSCRNTTFAIAPDFHGCKFHQDTSFKGSRFADVTREDAAAAYRTLKLAMEGLRAKDEESRFYSLEQRSWRNNVKDAPFAKAFSALYDWGSDYGRSIGKPIAWILGSFFFFLVIYFHSYAAETYCVSGPAENLGKLEIVARYQLTQLVRPFEALTFRNAELGQAKSCVIPFRLAGISAIQTLLQLSLIALLFLAIRRRFKME